MDGTVSEQVEAELNCSLVICDYGKVRDCMILKQGKRKIWLKKATLRT